MSLNWTKAAGSNHGVDTPHGSYAAVRKSGRHYLVFGGKNAFGAPEPIVLGSDTLAKVKVLAEKHYTQITQAATPAQTTDPLPDRITPPEGTPIPQGDPNPNPNGPDVSRGQPDAPTAVPAGNPDRPEAGREATNVSVPLTPLTEVQYMPAVFQKTKAPSKAKAKKSRQNATKNKAKAAATQAAAPAANGDKVHLPAPLSPKQRPDGLAMVVDPATVGAMPPAGTDPSQVHEWAEALRDDYEADGKLLTVKGLIALARAALGDDAGPVVRQVKAIYADEYAAEKAGKAPPANEVKAKGKRGRPKSANPRQAPVFEDVKVKPNKSGVEVEAKKSLSGKVYARVFGLPYKSVIRWMGYDKWTYPEAVDVLTKLDLMKFTAGHSQDHVRNNLSSGRHGDDGWVGPLPKLTKEQKDALRAMKPKA